jgi:hypothetical protein
MAESSKYSKTLLDDEIWARRIDSALAWSAHNQIVSVTPHPPNWGRHPVKSRSRMGTCRQGRDSIVGVRLVRKMSSGAIIVLR